MSQKRFCPNCGSRDVEPDMSENTAFVEGNINDWECNNCGYSGLMPEGDPSERDFEEKDIQAIEVPYSFPKPDSRQLSVILIVISVALAILSVLI